MNIILEIANNHMGSEEHGKLIVDQFAEMMDQTFASYFIKFQYRDLDSYIDPSVKGDLSIHFVKRFESTKLSAQQFDLIKEHARARGFKLACTPFDPVSADRVVKERFDLIKIASACIDDWDLLEALVKSLSGASDYTPGIVFSTGGATLEQIDRLYSFLTHRTRCPITIMHCIAKYPYEAHESLLSNIGVLKRRYHNASIGYSAHEKPVNTGVGALALVAGATWFEKHVGVDTDEHENNQYTVLPNHFSEWQDKLKLALAAWGNPSFERSSGEKDTIVSLKRGAILVSSVEKGGSVDSACISYTFPRLADQLGPEHFGIFSPQYQLLRDVNANDRLMTGYVEEGQAPSIAVRQKVAEFVHSAKGLLREAGITYPIDSSQVELSHHEGVEKIDSVGALLITRVDTDLYSKKLVVQTAGQHHPTHFHPLKDETFEVLYGKAIMEVGELGPMVVGPGDIVRVPPGTKHSFRTSTGVVFEEIATKAIQGDSRYDQELHPERKSILDEYWAKF